ncbi:hypothetical protein SAMN05421663_102501 [Terribacillus halophilus]|uniref:DUF4190 domain-containing protein n=1 Tax=Terribacillus halophilus TaxID=361279 RepID=A0A1G6LTZ5_9BACI|nr:hypothetical protein [Terribacillus halophilus]SDC46720.1 hypothetical protein SAMN05421663_102501 [Terribacillus halophilus]
MEEKRYSPSGTLALGIVTMFIPVIGIISGILAIIFANKSLKVTEDTEAIKALYLGGRVCAIIGLCYQGLMVIYIIFIFTIALSPLFY